MSLHKEIEFENDICAPVAAHGWRCYADGDAAGYDRRRPLFFGDRWQWWSAHEV